MLTEMQQDEMGGCGTPAHLTMWLQEADTPKTKGGPIVRVKKKINELLMQQVYAMW